MSDTHARKAVSLLPRSQNFHHQKLNTLLLDFGLFHESKTTYCRHKNIKGQLRFVATEYRHEQGNILEMRGGVRSSSRSRGSRSGAKAVIADLSDGMDSMVYSKGQSRDVTRLGFPHRVSFLRKYRWPISYKVLTSISL